MEAGGNEEEVCPDFEDMVDVKVDAIPVREIKIRLDLRPYYEVVDHAACKLKCKLNGKDLCVHDGVRNSFSYSSRNGWYRFERHLARRHKIMVGAFLKRKNVAEHVEAKVSKSHGGKKLKHVKKDDFSFSHSRFRQADVSWENLRRTEKYCFVCRNVCTEPSDFEKDTLSQLFTVAEGFVPNLCDPTYKDALSEQLFVIFFLRDIIDFPMTLCEKFLKQCKGMRSPETWISFCSACKSRVMEGIYNRRKIAELEKAFAKIKKSLNEKVRVGCVSMSADVNTDLRDIEEQIRKYVRFTANLHTKYTITQHSKRDADDVATETNPGDISQQHWKDSDYVTADNDDDTIQNKDFESELPSVFPNRRKKPKPGYYAKMQNCHFKSEERDSKRKEQVKSAHVRKTDSVDNIHLKDEPTSPSPDDDQDAYFDFNNDLPDVDADDPDSEYEPEPRRKSTKKSPAFTRKTVVAKTIRKAGKGVADKTKKPMSPNSKALGGSGQKKNRYEDEKEEFMCELCSSKYSSSRSFKDHVNIHQISKLRNNEYDCPQCGFPCLTLKAQKVHIGIKHRDNNDLACNLCPYIGSSKRNLFLHMNEHKETSQKERVGGKYLCGYCNRLFISYVLLCRHKRLKHYQEIGVALPKCEICSQTFSCKQHLRSHIRQVHEKISRYFCETCGKGFLFNSKLKRHAIAHINERGHVCEICGADFRYGETLRNHKLREHQDSEGTVKTNPNNPLVNEKPVTSDNAEYTCKHCAKNFSTKSLLHRHVKRDHDELYSFKCDMCNNGYATPQSLRRHKEINHSALEKPCPFCGKMFAHQEYIRMHYKFCKRHPDRKTSAKLAGEVLKCDPQSGLQQLPELGAQSELGTEPDVSLLPDNNDDDGQGVESSLKIEHVQTVREQLVIPLIGSNYSVIFDTSQQ